MSNLSNNKKTKLRKVLSLVTSVTTIFALSGFAVLAPAVFAATPGQFGLTEGDTISASGSDDPDVYIVNEHGYKRLFLNPVIFGFYGHLGGFANVRNVSAATRDAFPTSGLFQLFGDQRVYGVETTGEDTGILHWVNTTGAQAVADDPDFFKKVFIINQNEFNWYAKGADYTSVSQVPDYSRQPGSTPAPSGPVSASLSPNSPGARTVTTNAQGVTLVTVRLTGNGTVDSLTFKRGGAGATGDFSNLYIYRGAERLVSGKSLSSSTGEVTFVNQGISVNGSVDISLVGDLSSATAGNVHNFSVVTITAGSASISGLPVAGSNVTVSGAASGTITLAKTGSIGNPNVGQKNVQLSEFKLTANTEAASVKRIQMIQGGTVKPGDISNLRLTTGSNTWNGTINSDGDIVFDLGSGFSIAKGGNAIFRVWGDLAGKKDETILLYFETATDILAVGDQFGFGMAATTTALDTSAEAHSLTLQGGVLTITFNGPAASTLGTDSDDVNLLEFSMTAASNIEIRKTEFNLCKDDTGSGTYNDAADTTNGWADLTDFKVVNVDTGVVVMGPQDGTAFTTDAATACPGSVGGAQKQFTDTLDLLAGNTYNFKVTADIDADDTGSGITLASGDKLKVELDNYTDDTPDLTVAKYSGTNTTVADADIVPGASIAGPEFELSASSLTLALASSPASQTFVKGTQGVDAVGLAFTASLASGLKVTDVTLTGYVADSGSTVEIGVGTGADASLSVAKLVSAVKIYDGETGALISSTPASNNLNTSTGTVVFNNLAWNIPAGATKTLLVRADLSSLSVSGSSDVFSFDIDATTDVTALDDSNNTVNAAAGDPNGATSATIFQTVSSGGTLAATLAPASPSTGAVYWGQSNVEFSKFRFTSTNEAYFIERLNLDTADTAANMTANIKNVTLAYTALDEVTNQLVEKTAIGTFNNAGSVSFAFSGSNRPYVPKDSSADVTVLANLKNNSEGATNAVNFSIDFSGGAADEFRAIGAGSDALAIGTDAGIVNRAGNNQYVYRVFPRFTKVADSVSSLTPTDSEVLRFTVEAMGLSDASLVFDGATDAASGTIKFEIVASGSDTTATPTFNVYDAANDELLDTGSLADTTADPSPNASLSFDFSSKTGGVEISGGNSKTFYVRVDLSKFADDGDYFQIVLRDDEASLVKWQSNSEDTTSVTSVLRQLPLFGTTKVRNI